MSVKSIRLNLVNLHCSHFTSCDSSINKTRRNSHKTNRCLVSLVEVHVVSARRKAGEE